MNINMSNGLEEKLIDPEQVEPYRSSSSHQDYDEPYLNNPMAVR